MTDEEILQLAIHGNLYGFPRHAGLSQTYFQGCDLAPFEDRELLELLFRILDGDIVVSDEEQERIHATLKARSEAH